jgi:antirestriction protein ArdC
MNDLHQTMTDRILASVDEAGAWKPCWQGMTGGLPTNAATGKRYNGVNILSLWLSGFGSNRWATYKQWETLGGQVRKGERGTPIIFYKVIEKDGEANRMVLRGSYVFNAEQVDGAPAAEAAPLTLLSADQRLEALDRWLMDRSHVMRLVSREDEYAAYYQPAIDTIHMPPFEVFNTPEHYYSVLFHEATHWTGHKSRLDRLGTYVGEGRAFEELVAELGAAFLCAEHGIEQVTRDDHVSYIASWLKHLKNDKKFIVAAASQASAAVSFLDNIEQERLAA